MNTTNPNTTQPIPRILNLHELALAGGGAIYMKVEGIKGTVSATNHGGPGIKIYADVVY